VHPFYFDNDFAKCRSKLDNIWQVVEYEQFVTLLNADLDGGCDQQLPDDHQSQTFMTLAGELS